MLGSAGDGTRICAACGAENSVYNPACVGCGQLLDESLATTHPQISREAEPAQHEALEAGMRLGQFRVVRHVGQGGMGTVYEAWDCDLDRPVALKLIRNGHLLDEEHLKQKLLAEARAASALHHPNIVTMYGVFREAGHSFIAMEWVQGKTLNELIPPGGLEAETLLDYAQALAEGLARAHRAEIMHRDIKPSNILVTDDGTVKILDFGLARILSSDPVVERAWMGTPAYMAPEQATGMGIGMSADVYAFALVLIEMGLGKRPQGHEPNPVVAQASLAELRKAKPGVPNLLISVLSECLQKDSERRPADMGVVQAMLGALKNKRAGSDKRLLVLLSLFLVLASIFTYRYYTAPRPTAAVRLALKLQSLAVMPIDNLTGDPALDIFCDGFAASVNTALSRTERGGDNTWVMPSTELRRLDHIDPQELFKRFGVRHALSSSVKYVREGLRFDIQLVQADSLRVVRSGVLVLTREALYNGQEPLLDEVLKVLDWQIDAEARREVMASATGVSGAYQHYIEGLSYNYRADKAGNLDRAEQALQAALDLDPNYVPALVALTETYRAMWIFDKTPDSVEKGLEVVERALALRNDLAVVHTAHGYLLLEKGRWAEAETAFQTALGLRPKQGPALYGLGRTLTRASRFEEAEKAFQQASLVSPYDWLGQTEFGRLYYEQGDMKKAEKVFRRLTELAPENPRSMSNLAIILYSMNRLDDAAAILGKALALEPNGNLYDTYGNILYARGDYAGAVAAFRQAVALLPDRFVHHGNLADVLRQLGRIDEARVAYAQAIRLTREGLKINPEDTRMGILLVHYLARSGQIEAARSQLRKLGEPSGAAMCYYHALAHELIGERDQALTYISAALNHQHPVFEIESEPDFKDLRQDSRYLAIATPFLETEASAP